MLVFFPFYIVSCLRLRLPYVLAPCICAVPTCVHGYVRARIPTAMLFFCCHKCHTKGEIDAKTADFFGGR